MKFGGFEEFGGFGGFGNFGDITIHNSWTRVPVFPFSGKDFLESRVFRKTEMEKTCGVTEFAERADLSINLPTSAAVTLYVICSFEGWTEAFAAVDEDPLDEEEIRSIEEAIRVVPVGPNKWFKVVQKLVVPWTYKNFGENLGNLGKRGFGEKGKWKEVLDRMVDFSIEMGFEKEWADGLRPGLFIKVIAFYMSLYHSSHCREWINLFSKKYDIDIPYDMHDRLSRWKKTNPSIDSGVLCVLARQVKRAAV
jgi:hypothetical protein